MVLTLMSNNRAPHLSHACDRQKSKETKYKVIKSELHMHHALIYMSF